MDTNLQNENEQESTEAENGNLNANSASSGSGAMQPEDSTGEADKLGDYPKNTPEDIKKQIKNISSNQSDASKTTDSADEKKKPAGGRTFKETTDPAKLSDI